MIDAIWKEDPRVNPKGSIVYNLSEQDVNNANQEF